MLSVGAFHYPKMSPYIFTCISLSPSLSYPLCDVLEIQKKTCERGGGKAVKASAPPLMANFVLYVEVQH